MSILYNENSKLISLSDSEETNEVLSINVNQINSLTKSLIGESNNNFTPKPNDNTTKLIKNLFDSGITKMKQQKLNEALKNVSLAIEMSRRSRNSY